VAAELPLLEPLAEALPVLALQLAAATAVLLLTGEDMTVLRTMEQAVAAASLSTHNPT
jgi:hypothetical protein